MVDAALSTFLLSFFMVTRWECARYAHFVRLLRSKR